MRAWPRRLFYGMLFCAPVGLMGLRHWRGQNAPFVPGYTSDGHHQIESQCALCHKPWEGVMDDACLACHGSSLEARNDTHAPAKFEDPARADQLAFIDARSCVACHREHRAEARLRGSVSVPTTFCIDCHQDIRRDRVSHREFSDSGCASAGCHNYHDNRALYRDLLVKHRGAADLLADPRVPTHTTRTGPVPEPASALAPDLPPAYLQETQGRAGQTQARWKSSLLPAINEWAQSAHARENVNCTGCHQRPAITAVGLTPTWSWTVDDTACASCHQQERLGFRAGKHGMRLTAGLGAMSPGQARAPMKLEASGRTLGCTSCHGSHRFDRVQAAVSACEGCHNDEHTRRYRASKHFTAWLREQRQQAPPGSGVSCATCHLPRFTATHVAGHPAQGNDGGQDHDVNQENDDREEGVVVRVEHNQNGNLRPNDRMWRDVCVHCHGARFSLAALVDPALVMGNFFGAPTPALTSMDLIEKERTDAKK